MRPNTRCLAAHLGAAAEEAGEHDRSPTTSCAWLRSHTVDAHGVQAQERKKREKLQEKERKKQEKLQKKQDKKKGKGSPEAPEDPNQVRSSCRRSVAFPVFRRALRSELT